MKLKDFLYLKDKADGELSPNIIIAHKNCPDGAASIVLFQAMFPQNYYITAVHERMEQIVLHAADILEAGGKLFIVDIAPPREVLPKLFERISNKNAFCGIYDHHESTSWLQKASIPAGTHAEISFNSTRCGSAILYDRYCDTYPKLKVYENFITHTNDRDLWLRQDPLSDELAFLHKLLGDAAYINRFRKNPKVDFTHDESTIMNFSKQIQTSREEKLLRSMRISEDSQGYKYGLVYGDGDSSDLLNKAIERYHLEYALLVNLNTKRASMRGRGNRNCATYAEGYHGGGHKCASGFPIEFTEPIF